jgi:hypothetical protein
MQSGTQPKVLACSHLCMRGQAVRREHNRVPCMHACMHSHKHMTHRCSPLTCDLAVNIILFAVHRDGSTIERRSHTAELGQERACTQHNTGPRPSGPKILPIFTAERTHHTCMHVANTGTPAGVDHTRCLQCMILGCQHHALVAREHGDNRLGRGAGHGGPNLAGNQNKVTRIRKSVLGKVVSIVDSW